MTGSIHNLLLTIVLLIAIIPVLDGNTRATTDGAPVPGFEQHTESTSPHATQQLSRRDTSPVNVCFRWAQQSAVVNGTLYLYGGEASQTQGQTENTWNNYFYTLDLTKTWSISQPSLTGLTIPNGPPAVALGYLWNSHQSLYLYGGEVSSRPAVQPPSNSVWEYDITSQSWQEHSNPETSDGVNAPMNNAVVQRTAEGAGANVPSLGRGFYFGGHQDGYTTTGWSQSIPRLYLQSLLEFTMPGAKNDQVNALSNGRTAGTAGNYRNITQGGYQTQSGFTTRADGLLMYIPSYGMDGILVALAAGTNETFTQMNVLDIYDIATSTWYKQSTTGAYPSLRVNPCGVVAAAADGSSYNIYMFGGQDLVPYGNQTQYSDMWILSVPSFAWISVDQSKQSVPYGRSGHTCNIWDGQMVMVGGYTGTQLTCESTGIYVFDLSSLQWVQQYSASSDRSANPFSQQTSQITGADTAGGAGGLEGSYGYQVPAAVISVIGGGPSGGATVTAPIATATSGPLATGNAVSYTVTATSQATSTGAATTDSGGSGGGNGGGSAGGSSSTSHGANVGSIVAGVIAGLLFLVVCYLLFCMYVYRKQVRLYRHHAEMAQRHSQMSEKGAATVGLLASTTKSSDRSSGDKKAVSRPDHYSWNSHAQSSQHNSGGSGSASNSGLNVPRPGSSHSDLLDGHEPSFVGVMLNPRRSLRVINRD